MLQYISFLIFVLWGTRSVAQVSLELCLQPMMATNFKVFPFSFLSARITKRNHCAELPRIFLLEEFEELQIILWKCKLPLCSHHEQEVGCIDDFLKDICQEVSSRWETISCKELFWNLFIFYERGKWNWWEHHSRLSLCTFINSFGFLSSVIVVTLIWGTKVD